MFRFRHALVASLAVCAAWSVAQWGRAESLAMLGPIRPIDKNEPLPPEKVPVITSVTLGPGGARIATSGDDHLVRIKNTKDGSLVQRLAGHADWVRAVRFDASGRFLATAGDDRRIRIWTLDAPPAEDGRPPRISVSTPEQVIHALVFRPDGKMLAAAGFSGQVLLLDTQTGEIRETLDAASGDVRALAFSPDGAQLAAAGRDGTIRVWNTADGRHIADLVGHTQRVRALTYVTVPDTAGGQVPRLASGGDDRQLRLWDVAAGTSEALPVRSGKILSLGYCPPGRLAVGASDNLIRVWDLAARRELCVLAGHTGSVAELAWNVTEGSLVSGSFDTTVLVWRLPEARGNQLSHVDATR
ncbi:MAG: WD40 repeat domain-containing protein [Pirellulales bacterium]|nr:WD40 repeat domain-containing protein [Pirellulales bacterium]